MKSKASGLEMLFDALWRCHGTVQPVREHRFHPTRRWRFDFAWPDAKVAVEMEGGAFTGGRHNRGNADIEKYNAAVLLGWRVLRYTVKEIKERPGDIVKQVAACLSQ